MSSEKSLCIQKSPFGKKAPEMIFSKLHEKNWVGERASDNRRKLFSKLLKIPLEARHFIKILIQGEFIDNFCSVSRREAVLCSQISEGFQQSWSKNMQFYFSIIN